MSTDPFKRPQGVVRVQVMRTKKKAPISRTQPATEPRPWDKLLAAQAAFEEAERDRAARAG